jgi:hypothetical protein
MTLPATAQDIYDRLVADEFVSDRLGVYTFPDGSQIPAIAVLGAHEKLPPGTIADGLEVTITAMPLYGPQLLYDGVLSNPEWRIYVVAWQSAADLQAVTERIMVLLPGAKATPLQADAPGEGLGVLNQVVITWTNVAAVLEG